MTSLLLLSHSRQIADGLKELALEMNPNVSIYAVGGTNSGTTGSDYDKMKETLDRALQDGDVVVLFDLGSAMMTIEMVMDELDVENRQRVFLSDAALVEGAIVAAVCIDGGMTAEMVFEELKALSLKKM